MTLVLGTPVRLEMTKWGDRPHWEFAATYLGADEHGDWIGIPVGTHMSRPGAAFDTVVAQVGLVPRGVGWVSTFHAPGWRIATYVDMTTVPGWDGTTCRTVDLDLDVVRTADGHVFVDDEDEFAEHQVRYGYPPEVIALAEESAAWVHEAVLAERAPFDGDTADRWLRRLADLLGPDAPGRAR
ncbi:DUF402 domain-containing protein [Nocardioides plantarum]|uniref:DUF402 domain-containing protein n=1 Tax=Nocardioides plantarum TaxID=29299 RepID=A0ABV5K7V7_9ACTN|nr:DUF402 domain-containing protein [Nocardioides plantarum]